MFKQNTNHNQWHVMKLFMTFLLLFVFIKAYVFSSFVVDGISMEPTLKDGNMIMVNEMVYTYQAIDHFDIIVFKNEDGSYFVKRVIGLPGDQVEMKEGHLYLNGNKIEESYINYIQIDSILMDFNLEEITGESHIPAGKLFVLGDNRERSLDSRNFGFINQESVVGKVDLHYWSMSQLAVKLIN
ncbi:signal peptidase I [Amphibacillus marinus]|uniref:Signal peptidase I n=1 Tax=Amphibacillus marinus TaxID=872970 RepID=A0A1H8RVI7_9BACI|nr:signal peptidase I [Amphibacillus marinus]SEO70365.1 signal peptidase I [Amphibacillus marinus]